MKKRTETHKRKKKPIAIKLLISSLLFFVIIGSSLNVAFADKDIGAILTNWFDQKEATAINEIKEAVSSEQSKQTNRLKQALKKEIKSADKRLNKQVKKEKKDSIKAIQKHTNQLIKNLDIDNSSEKAKATKQLNAILQDAIDEMNAVNQKTNMKSEQNTKVETKPETSTNKKTNSPDSADEKKEQTNTKHPDRKSVV